MCIYERCYKILSIDMHQLLKNKIYYTVFVKFFKVIFYLINFRLDDFFMQTKKIVKYYLVCFYATNWKMHDSLLAFSRNFCIFKKTRLASSSIVLDPSDVKNRFSEESKSLRLQGLFCSPSDQITPKFKNVVLIFLLQNRKIRYLICMIFCYLSFAF